MDFIDTIKSILASVLAGTEHENQIDPLAEALNQAYMLDKLETSMPFIQSLVKAEVDDFIDKLKAAISEATLTNVSPD